MSISVENSSIKILALKFLAVIGALFVTSRMIATSAYALTDDYCRRSYKHLFCALDGADVKTAYEMFTT